MKPPEPGEYTWVFALRVIDKNPEIFLKLIQIDQIGFTDDRQWVFLDEEENQYYAKDCMEADYQPIDEKIDYET